MSFNTAVTGLKAASTMLDVTGNNIANVATTGFKSSRTQFADLYATSVVGAGSSNTPGSGVTVSGISQDFSAGTIEFTNNNLDLAINGSGFFQLDDGRGSVTYTRAGAFELNKEGLIVSPSGKFLQGYGLDAQGNQLPIGNLAVKEKESLPKATDNINLAVNIDARADATTLTPTYSKDDPSSFTYSTTVRTFDSLGNPQTLKYNFAEQRPVRELFVFDLAVATDFPRIAGVQLTAVDFDTEGRLIDNLAVTPPQLSGFNAISQADPRIDLTTVRRELSPPPASTPTGRVTFEFKSWASDTGQVLVQNPDQTSATKFNTLVADRFREANETRTYDITVDGNKTTAIGTTGNILLAGVTIPIAASNTAEQIAQAIKNREAQILDRNPEIESVEINTLGAVPTVTLKFKADVGNLDNASPVYKPRLTLTDPPAGAGLQFGDNLITTAVTDSQIETSNIVEGDNDYRGYYRMYAYLNNVELLDIGKPQVPGAGVDTEPGQILIKFNPSNGLLTEVNGEQFPAGGRAPSIQIKGADPASETTVIDMRLDNTTQFASASIVKSQQQNGYAKGDLIGVTFAPTGEMIASFSNGQEQRLGIVAFATFENQDGLQPVGNTEWIASLQSGNPILNAPGTGLNGTLRSAALEQSNVDLSTELVNLIQAQRNFQASSKTLETVNNITQNILNI
ncbi:flagellar hook-basal body complex protein [Nitrincola nitratireducens]|uniref:Flagellar hook protein FlgE n=1 Tax=Nitrincola nitratireducens TaxID=1229521 RepID=W9V063_9GAMM|nr:flagellar hook-basal body complex protein [Nitrincola nitratireducens]EXJ09527.1 Flagellar hook protein flgE [Nitrincola nitratireducens]